MPKTPNIVRRGNKILSKVACLGRRSLDWNCLTGGGSQESRPKSENSCYSHTQVSCAVRPPVGVGAVCAEELPQLTWPACYPPGVPPVGAVPASGHAFRMVAVIPPTADDFISKYEEDPTRKFKPWQELSKYSVSFFRDHDIVLEYRGRYKNNRNKLIVSGTLDASHGVQKEGHDSHVDMWRFGGAVIHPAFTTSGEV